MPKKKQNQSGILSAQAFRRPSILFVAMLVLGAGVLAYTFNRNSQGSHAATVLRSVAEWEQLFLGRWNVEDADYSSKTASNDSWNYYNAAYGLDGATAMFRATGKTQYLDRALKYSNNMMGAARLSSTMTSSQYRDGYMGWVSQRSDVQGKEVPLFESYGWRYVTNMLVAMKNNPTVMTNASYKAQYDKLLAFSERNMFDKWTSRGMSNIYRQNTHMASHWAFISMDIAALTSDPTRKQKALTIADNINHHIPSYSNNSLRGQLRHNSSVPSAYVWSANWGSTSSPQDTAHGNGVMAYVVEAKEMGQEWTLTDMKAFVSTLNNVIWKSAGSYGDYVDGSGTGTGWFNDGFIKLGRYDIDLQKRLESHSVARNMDFYAQGALNVKILTGAAPAPAPAPTPAPAPAPAPTPTPPPPTDQTLGVNPYSCSSHPTLKKGSSGVCVKRVQWFLNAENSAGLTVDGDFGSNTDRAVRNYQTKNRLKVDGVVGPNTWASLEAGA